MGVAKRVFRAPWRLPTSNKNIEAGMVNAVPAKTLSDILMLLASHASHVLGQENLVYPAAGVALLLSGNLLSQSFQLFFRRLDMYVL